MKVKRSTSGFREVRRILRPTATMLIIIYISNLFPVLTPRAEASEVDPYEAVQEIGQSCYQGFRENQGLGRGLVQELFFLPGESTSKASLGTVSTNQSELYEVATEATQNYLNQTLYGFRVFKKAYGMRDDLNTKLASSSNPQLKEALRVSSEVISKQSIPTLSAEDLADQVMLVDSLHQKINQVCSIRHQTYVKLMKMYQNKAYQNEEINPEVQTLLYPYGKPSAYPPGGMDGLIRSRITQERELGALETSIYRSMVSSTYLSFLVDTKTDLQKQIGDFDALSCVEKGSQLKMISDPSKIEISKRQVSKKFQDTIERLAPPKDLWHALSAVGRNDKIQDIMKDYIRENPRSIQLALFNNPKVSHAKAVCSMVQSMQSDSEPDPIQIAGRLALTLSTWEVGGPLIWGALGVYGIGANSVDIYQSKQVQARLEQSILSEQIDPQVAQSMIGNIKQGRVNSWVSLYLSGIIAVASAMRITKLLNQGSTWKGTTGFGETPIKPQGDPKNLFYKAGDDPELFGNINKPTTPTQLRVNPNPKLSNVKVGEAGGLTKSTQLPQTSPANTQASSWKNFSNMLWSLNPFAQPQTKQEVEAPKVISNQKNEAEKETSADLLPTKNTGNNRNNIGTNLSGVANNSKNIQTLDPEQEDNARLMMLQTLDLNTIDGRRLLCNAAKDGTKQQSQSFALGLIRQNRINCNPFLPELRNILNHGLYTLNIEGSGLNEDKVRNFFEKFGLYTIYDLVTLNVEINSEGLVEFSNEDSLDVNNTVLHVQTFSKKSYDIFQKLLQNIDPRLSLGSIYRYENMYLRPNASDAGTYFTGWFNNLIGRKPIGFLNPPQIETISNPNNYQLATNSIETGVNASSNNNLQSSTLIETDPYERNRDDDSNRDKILKRIVSDFTNNPLSILQNFDITKIENRKLLCDAVKNADHPLHTMAERILSRYNDHPQNSSKQILCGEQKSAADYAYLKMKFSDIDLGNDQVGKEAKKFIKKTNILHVEDFHHWTIFKEDSKSEYLKHDQMTMWIEQISKEAFGRINQVLEKARKQLNISGDRYSLDQGPKSVRLKNGGGYELSYQEQPRDPFGFNFYDPKLPYLNNSFSQDIAAGIGNHSSPQILPPNQIQNHPASEEALTEKLLKGEISDEIFNQAATQSKLCKILAQTDSITVKKAIGKILKRNTWKCYSDSTNHSYLSDNSIGELNIYDEDLTPLAQIKIIAPGFRYRALMMIAGSWVDITNGMPLELRATHSWIFNPRDGSGRIEIKTGQHTVSALIPSLEKRTGQHVLRFEIKPGKWKFLFSKDNVDTFLLSSEDDNYHAYLKRKKVGKNKYEYEISFDSIKEEDFVKAEKDLIGKNDASYLIKKDRYIELYVVPDREQLLKWTTRKTGTKIQFIIPENSLGADVASTSNQVTSTLGFNISDQVSNSFGFGKATSIDQVIKQSNSAIPYYLQPSTIQNSSREKDEELIAAQYALAINEPLATSIMLISTFVHTMQKEKLLCDAVYNKNAQYSESTRQKAAALIAQINSHSYTRAVECEKYFPNLPPMEDVLNYGIDRLPLGTDDVGDKEAHSFLAQNKIRDIRQLVSLTVHEFRREVVMLKNSDDKDMLITLRAFQKIYRALVKLDPRLEIRFIDSSEIHDSDKKSSDSSTAVNASANGTSTVTTITGPGFGYDPITGGIFFTDQFLNTIGLPTAHTPAVQVPFFLRPPTITNEDRYETARQLAKSGIYRSEYLLEMLVLASTDAAVLSAVLGFFKSGKIQPAEVLSALKNVRDKNDKDKIITFRWIAELLKNYSSWFGKKLIDQIYAEANEYINNETPVAVRQEAELVAVQIILIGNAAANIIPSTIYPFRDGYSNAGANSGSNIQKYNSGNYQGRIFNNPGLDFFTNKFLSAGSDNDDLSRDQNGQNLITSGNSVEELQQLLESGETSDHKFFNTDNLSKVCSILSKTKSDTVASNIDKVLKMTGWKCVLGKGGLFAVSDNQSNIFEIFDGQLNPIAKIKIQENAQFSRVFFSAYILLNNQWINITQGLPESLREKISWKFNAENGSATFSVNGTEFAVKISAGKTNVPANGHTTNYAVNNVNHVSVTPGNGVTELPLSQIQNGLNAQNVFAPMGSVANSSGQSAKEFAKEMEKLIQEYEGNDLVIPTIHIRNFIGFSNTPNQKQLCETAYDKEQNLIERKNALILLAKYNSTNGKRIPCEQYLSGLPNLKDLLSTRISINDFESAGISQSTVVSLFGEDSSISLGELVSWKITGKGTQTVVLNGPNETQLRLDVEVINAINQILLAVDPRLSLGMIDFASEIDKINKTIISNSSPSRDSFFKNIHKPLQPDQNFKDLVPKIDFRPTTNGSSIDQIINQSYSSTPYYLRPSTIKNSSREEDEAWIKKQYDIMNNETFLIMWLASEVPTLFVQEKRLCDAVYNKDADYTREARLKAVALIHQANRGGKLIDCEQFYPKLPSLSEVLDDSVDRLDLEGLFEKDKSISEEARDFLARNNLSKISQLVSLKVMEGTRASVLLENKNGKRFSLSTIAFVRIETALMLLDPRLTIAVNADLLKKELAEIQNSSGLMPLSHEYPVTNQGQPIINNSQFFGEPNNNADMSHRNEFNSNPLSFFSNQGLDIFTSKFLSTSKDIPTALLPNPAYAYFLNAGKSIEAVKKYFTANQGEEKREQNRKWLEDPKHKIDVDRAITNLQNGLFELNYFLEICRWFASREYDEVLFPKFFDKIKNTEIPEILTKYSDTTKYTIDDQATILWMIVARLGRQDLDDQDIKDKILEAAKPYYKIKHKGAFTDALYFITYSLKLPPISNPSVDRTVGSNLNTIQGNKNTSSGNSQSNDHRTIYNTFSTPGVPPSLQPNPAYEYFSHIRSASSENDPHQDWIEKHKRLIEEASDAMTGYIILPNYLVAIYHLMFSPNEKTKSIAKEAMKKKIQISHILKYLEDARTQFEGEKVSVDDQIVALELLAVKIIAKKPDIDDELKLEIETELNFYRKLSKYEPRLKEPVDKAFYALHRPMDGDDIVDIIKAFAELTGFKATVINLQTTENIPMVVVFPKDPLKNWELLNQFGSLASENPFIFSDVEYNSNRSIMTMNMDHGGKIAKIVVSANELKNNSNQPVEETPQQRDEKAKKSIELGVLDLRYFFQIHQYAQQPGTELGKKAKEMIDGYLKTHSVDDFLKLLQDVRNLSSETQQRAIWMFKAYLPQLKLDEVAFHKINEEINIYLGTTRWNGYVYTMGNAVIDEANLLKLALIKEYKRQNQSTIDNQNLSGQFQQFPSNSATIQNTQVNTLAITSSLNRGFPFNLAGSNLPLVPNSIQPIMNNGATQFEQIVTKESVEAWLLSGNAFDQNFNDKAKTNRAMCEVAESGSTDELKVKATLFLLQKGWKCEGYSIQSLSEKFLKIFFELRFFWSLTSSDEILSVLKNILFSNGFSELEKNYLTVEFNRLLDSGWIKLLIKDLEQQTNKTELYQKYLQAFVDYKLKEGILQFLFSIRSEIYQYQTKFSEIQGEIQPLMKSEDEQIRKSAIETNNNIEEVRKILAETKKRGGVVTQNTNAWSPDLNGTQFNHYFYFPAPVSTPTVQENQGGGGPSIGTIYSPYASYGNFSSQLAINPRTGVPFYLTPNDSQNNFITSTVPSRATFLNTKSNFNNGQSVIHEDRIKKAKEYIARGELNLNFIIEITQEAVSGNKDAKNLIRNKYKDEILIELLNNLKTFDPDRQVEILNFVNDKILAKAPSEEIVNQILNLLLPIEFLVNQGQEDEKFAEALKNLLNSIYFIIENNEYGLNFDNWPDNSNPFFDILETNINVGYPEIINHENYLIMTQIFSTNSNSPYIFPDRSISGASYFRNYVPFTPQRIDTTFNRNAFLNKSSNEPFDNSPNKFNPSIVGQVKQWFSDIGDSAVSFFTNSNLNSILVGRGPIPGSNPNDVDEQTMSVKELISKGFMTHSKLHDKSSLPELCEMLSDETISPRDADRIETILSEEGWDCDETIYGPLLKLKKIKGFQNDHEKLDALGELSEEILATLIKINRKDPDLKLNSNIQWIEKIVAELAKLISKMKTQEGKSKILQMLNMIDNYGRGIGIDSVIRSLALHGDVQSMAKLLAHISQAAHTYSADVAKKIIAEAEKLNNRTYTLSYIALQALQMAKSHNFRVLHDVEPSTDSLPPKPQQQSSFWYDPSVNQAQKNYYDRGGVVSKKIPGAPGVWHYPDYNPNTTSITNSIWNPTITNFWNNNFQNTSTDGDVRYVKSDLTENEIITLFSSFQTDDPRLNGVGVKEKICKILADGNVEGLAKVKMEMWVDARGGCGSAHVSDRAQKSMDEWKIVTNSESIGSQENKDKQLEIIENLIEQKNILSTTEKQQILETILTRSKGVRDEVAEKIAELIDAFDPSASYFQIYIHVLSLNKSELVLTKLLRLLAAGLQDDRYTGIQPLLPTTIEPFTTSPNSNLSTFANRLDTIARKIPFDTKQPPSNSAIQTSQIGDSGKSGVSATSNQPPMVMIQNPQSANDHSPSFLNRTWDSFWNIFGSTKADSTTPQKEVVKTYSPKKPETIEDLLMSGQIHDPKANNEKAVCTFAKTHPNVTVRFWAEQLIKDKKWTCKLVIFQIKKLLKDGDIDPSVVITLSQDSDPEIRLLALNRLFQIHQKDPSNTNVVMAIFNRVSDSDQNVSARANLMVVQLKLDPMTGALGLVIQKATELSDNAKKNLFETLKGVAITGQSLTPLSAKLLEYFMGYRGLSEKSENTNVNNQGGSSQKVNKNIEELLKDDEREITEKLLAQWSEKNEKQETLSKEALDRLCMIYRGTTKNDVKEAVEKLLDKYKANCDNSKWAEFSKLLSELQVETDLNKEREIANRIEDWLKKLDAQSKLIYVKKLLEKMLVTKNEHIPYLIHVLKVFSNDAIILSELLNYLNEAHDRFMNNGKFDLNGHMNREDLGIRIGTIAKEMLEFASRSTGQFSIEELRQIQVFVEPFQRSAAYHLDIAALAVTTYTAIQNEIARRLQNNNTDLPSVMQPQYFNQNQIIRQPVMYPISQPTFIPTPDLKDPSKKFLNSSSVDTFVEIYKSTVNFLSSEFSKFTAFMKGLSDDQQTTHESVVSPPTIRDLAKQLLQLGTLNGEMSDFRYRKAICDILGDEKEDKELRKLAKVFADQHGLDCTPLALMGLGEIKNMDDPKDQIKFRKWMKNANHDEKIAFLKFANNKNSSLLIQQMLSMLATEDSELSIREKAVDALITIVPHDIKILRSIAELLSNQNDQIRSDAQFVLEASLADLIQLLKIAYSIDPDQNSGVRPDYTAAQKEEAKQKLHNMPLDLQILESIMRAARFTNDDPTIGFGTKYYQARKIASILHIASN